MNDRRDTTTEQFAYDSVAGPVYTFQPVAQEEAEQLAVGRDRPQIVEVLVWPYPEAVDHRPELRRYYALNLPQAVGRAVEIEIRLREQERAALLVGLRPATAPETEVFFRAMDILEAGMPGLIPIDHIGVTETPGGPRSVR